MDFFKMLMLYMSLTFATSVQGAPTPEITEVPTITPPAVVESLAPGESATPVPTITPTPDASATPVATAAPSPTITPNTAYRNLKQGDKGDRVKALQQRLIELGYLTGEADGAFGPQTYRAVLSFQAANGLSRDGVAGDATQTRLFEDPDVIPNPNRPTATPSPTDTPEPAATDAVVTLEPLASPEPSEAPAATAVPEGSGAMTLSTAVDAQGRTWLWDASIVMNDSGQALTCLRREDGVTVSSRPRLWQTADGTLLLSLADLADSLEDWTLSPADSGDITLTAAGYTVLLTPTTDAYTCAVDGLPVDLEEGDTLLMDGEAVITPAFLEKALGAQTLWDQEESTLIIRLVDKSIAQATD